MVFVSSGGRRACQLVAASALAMAAGTALASGPAAALAPPGPVFAQDTFTFTGALSGSLHLLPKQDCLGAGPVGVTLTIAGQLVGSRASVWVVQVLSLNNGTYGLRPNSVIGVTISDQDGSLQWGLDQRGALTVAGTSGTVDAELSGTAGTQIHVIGAWSCPNS